jgi:RsiW-degrading membrane proteinase PrsW (M82 family)
LVAVVILTFAVTSLAYFWGELRFYPVSDVVSESLIGVLIALVSSFVCLAFGLVNLSEIK